MSRSLVLGNGTVLITLDKYAQVRDFYFPYAGLENHIASGNAHKLGVWTDGNFSWLSDGTWVFSIDYQKETLASNIIARNESLGVELTFLDTVYNEKNIFLRTVVVKNITDHNKDIRLFFNHQFQISETTHADTAYFNPTVHAVVHYKGRRVFLVGGQSGGEKFDDYSVGIFKIEGKEGTWKDAEDGVLGKNPIEHGSIDSTIAFTCVLESGESKVVEYWITVAETFREALQLQDIVLTKTHTHIRTTTQDFWRAWVNKFNFSFYKLDNRVISLFKKSLLIVRTHCDNRGGILASGDSDNFRYGRDTYAYVWPRDGAFVAIALDKAGYFETAHRFYEFVSEVITADGYVLHKYQPDRSFGSSWHPWIKNGKSQLAIQEDETALIIIGLWEHYSKSKDLEFIEGLYNGFIKAGAQFMVRYREGFVTQLPYQSYDLWEEKNGISPFTASTVSGALKAAAQFARMLGKENEEQLYEQEALEIQKAIVTHFYNNDTEYFDKLITVEEGVVTKDPTIDISAFFGIFKFGILPVDDPRMVRAREVLKQKLHDPIQTGGYARYERDSYYEVTRDVPGNPWFITTLWMLQYDIKRAKTEEDLSKINDELLWVVQRALSSGILSEQMHPYTGEQLSVSPLTWSHAEYVLTVIAYLERLEELGICAVCYPVGS